MPCVASLGPLLCNLMQKAFPPCGTVRLHCIPPVRYTYTYVHVLQYTCVVPYHMQLWSSWRRPTAVAVSVSFEHTPVYSAPTPVPPEISPVFVHGMCEICT